MNPYCWKSARYSALVALVSLSASLHAREVFDDRAESTQSTRPTPYDAISRHLVPGGVVYGCVDLSGDADALRRFLADAPVPVREHSLPEHSVWRALSRFRLDPLVDLLGISDVTGVGVSSVARPDGLFDNRTFFYTPNGRHGVLEILGGVPGPFATASIAPRDVDFFYETEFDLSRAYHAVRSAAVELLGNDAGGSLDEWMAAALEPLGGVSCRDVVESARGRFSVVAVFESEKTAFVELDVPIKVPASHLLVRIEGVGRTLVPALDQIPLAELSIRDGRRHYAFVGEPWISTWTPAIVIDGDVAYFGSSQAFILACIGRKDGLTTDPAYAAAIEELGGSGNSILWIGPRSLSLPKRLMEMNECSHSVHIDDLRKWLPDANARIPCEPLVSIRRNLPDGILYRSRWNASVKRDVFSATLLNPLAMVMAAGILEPHYLRARERFQEMAIYSNLRRLQVFARQYCYDHHLTTVPIRTIMGDEPGKRVPTLTSVAGEDYRKLTFRENYPLSVTTHDGRVIEYGP